MKTITLTILLLFSFFTKAQDKYDFVVISYQMNYGDLTVSLNGKDVSQEYIKLPKDVKFQQNANPLLLKVNEYKVNEYQDANWEVMSFDDTSENTGTTSSQTRYFAFLRKKRTE